MQEWVQWGPKGSENRRRGVWRGWVSVRITNCDDDGKGAGGQARPANSTLPMAHRKRCTILVVDVIESVQRMDTDEAAFIQRWVGLVEQVVAEILPQRGGMLVKSLGDGMLLRFDDVPNALRAAFDIQAAALAAGQPPKAALPVRAGLHVDEVYITSLDIFGTGVNLAARLAGLSRGHEVVLSAAARDEVVDELDADLEDLGECFVKHLTRPVRCFRATPAKAVLPACTAPVMPPPPADAGLSLGALAVLPFTAMVLHPSHGALGQLVADGLISKLTGSSTLRVLSRLSTASLDSRSLDLRRIGELLGAQYVLSGTCHTQPGGRLRLQAELATVRTAEALWGGAVSGPLTDLLRDDSPLLDGLADQVAEALLAEEVRRARTQFLPSLESSTLLIGSIALMHRQSSSDFGRARELVEHLAERHPRHATPRAWLGKWYALSAAQGWKQDDASPERARDTISRALDLDGTNALAWTISGLLAGYMQREFCAAEQALRQALSHNPNEPLAWLYLATVMGWMRRADDAVQAVHLAQKLSPLNPMRYYFDSLCAGALLGADQPAQAAVLAERSLRRNQAHIATYKVLAIAKMLAGDGESARQAVAVVRSREPAFSVSRFLDVSPWGASPMAGQCAYALRQAGAPES
ncbi:MAG: hypothetical protein ACK4PH_00860 [Aquincola tertiaricarbonis]